MNIGNSAVERLPTDEHRHGRRLLLHMNYSPNRFKKLTCSYFDNIWYWTIQGHKKWKKNYHRLFCLIRTVFSFAVGLKRRGDRFDPGQADYGYWTVFADILDSCCEDKQNEIKIRKKETDHIKTYLYSSSWYYFNIFISDSIVFAYLYVIYLDILSEQWIKNHNIL